MTIRELAIARGWIRPGRPLVSLSASSVPGDPTPAFTIEAPTLKLDGAAVQAMKRDRERAAERRQPREDR
jgi:hypothetical protein